MSIPKWTEERTAQLVSLVEQADSINDGVIEFLAEQLETTKRSITAKLRKLEYEVPKAVKAESKWSAEQTAALADLIENAPGQYTYADLADKFEDFNAKQVQGKVLSLELTSAIKPSPPKEVVNKYTDEETEQFISMVKAGALVEELATTFNRTFPQIRGKALSLLRAGAIDAMPEQKESHSAAPADEFSKLGEVASLTVEAIAEMLGKTPRGVKTMLTRRGITVSDYDGAAKQAKLQKTAEA